ncbi:conserved hypothetical protein [Pseudomonas sp. PM2]
MHGKERFVSGSITVVGATCQIFNSDPLVTLTIGETVLQRIEPTVGKKGPRSQPYLFGLGRIDRMILQ